MAGATSDDTHHQLVQLLDSLRGADPFKTLAVDPTVDAEGVRRAYLAATKKLHPNRFAREPAATRDLANEVFLLIRRAYDILGDDDKRKQWRERLTASTPVLRPATPVPKPTTGLPSTPAAAAASPPAAQPAPPTTTRPLSPATAPPARSTSPSTAPPMRPATPTPGQPLPARPATPTPGERRPPITSAPASAPRPATEVEAMLESVRSRGPRFDEASALLARRQYAAAREAFYRLALEDPKSRRYRSHMHLAAAREHMEAARWPEAHKELERALQLDADLDAAKAALATVNEKVKKPGILGKLFGK